MRGLILIGAGLLVASCNNDPLLLSESEVEDIAADVAADEVAALRSEVETLQGRVEKLESQIENVSASHSSLVGTFNSNVDQRNQEKVDDMTRRGACGYEQVPVQNGAGVIVKPKECTLSDLR